MSFFVAEGKSLSFFLHTKRKLETKVTFKKAADGSVIGEVLTVPADRCALTGKDAMGNEAWSGRYSWTAPALDAEVLELDVLMVHDKQAAGTPPVKIKVFRDK